MIPSRRFWLLVGAIGWVLLLHMLLLAQAAPVVRSIRIALPGWPPGAPDMRIVFLSDLHPSSPGNTPTRLAQTVARINALAPDLVLIGGDLVADVAYARVFSVGRSLAPLAGLRPRLRTYAVLGNHDVGGKTRAARIEAGLGAVGVVRLDNQAVRIGPLALLGIPDIYSRQADVPKTLYSWRAVGGVPLAFTHSPDVVPLLPTTISLVLAGHTHCGQVRFPVIGAPSTQSRYGQRYGCGLIREGGRTTIVSAGLGLSGLPLRLGAAPDMWLVTVGR